ncbi:MAG: FtsW/RodA/SpoVE family cell cycle protein, partial [Candidatus Paceibacterota bacterium]
AFVIYFAAWISGVREKIATFKLGTIPFIVILILVSAVLLSQRDTDTLMVTAAAGLAMFISGGGRWRDLLFLCIIGMIGLGGIIAVRPYVLTRIKTFLDPSRDPLGSGYQIQQSLIAIGSGEVFGRGYGQSIQKFKFLPESIGDSIYAVAGEEFGFVGASGIILLFLLFVFRGLKIARRIPDMFGGLVVVGIIIIVVSQAFVNIGAMLAVLPLSGIPLPFFSHGGTALFFTLVEMGLILNISKFQRV